MDHHAGPRTEVLLNVKTGHIWILLVFTGVLGECNLRLVTGYSPFATFGLLIAVRYKLRWHALSPGSAALSLEGLSAAHTGYLALDLSLHILILVGSIRFGDRRSRWLRGCIVFSHCGRPYSLKLTFAAASLQIL